MTQQTLPIQYFYLLISSELHVPSMFAFHARFSAELCCHAQFSGSTMGSDALCPSPPCSSSSFSSSTALKLRVLWLLYFPDSVSSFLHSLPHPAEMGWSTASSTIANILSVLIPLSLPQSLLAKLNSRKKLHHKSSPWVLLEKIIKLFTVVSP